MPSVCPYLPQDRDISTVSFYKHVNWSLLAGSHNLKAFGLLYLCYCTAVTQSTRGADQNLEKEEVTLIPVLDLLTNSSRN